VTLKIVESDYRVHLIIRERRLRIDAINALKSVSFNPAGYASLKDFVNTINQGTIPHVAVFYAKKDFSILRSLITKIKVFSKLTRFIVICEGQDFEAVHEGLSNDVSYILPRGPQITSHILKKSQLLCRELCHEIYIKHLNTKIEQKHNENIEAQSKVKDYLQYVSDCSKILASEKLITHASSRMSKTFENSPVVFLKYNFKEGELAANTSYPKSFLGGTQPRFGLGVNNTENVEDLIEVFSRIKDSTMFKSFLKQMEALDSFSKKSLDVGQWMCHEMVVRGFPYGMFAVKLTETPTQDQYEEMVKLSAPIGICLENILLHQKITEISPREKDSRFWSEKFFNIRAKEEVKRALRYQYPLSVFFIRLENIPHLVELYGRKEVNVLAAKIKNIISQFFRESDVASIQDVHEYAVLSPNMHLSHATQKAKKLIEILNEVSEGKFSLSIGISEFPTHRTDSVSLLSAAKSVLPNAKDLTPRKSDVFVANKLAGHLSPFESRYIPSTRK